MVTGCNVDASQSYVKSDFWNETVWTCCSIEYNGLVTNFNVCLKIHFYNKGKGVFNEGTSFEKQFKWTEDGDKLVVKRMGNSYYRILKEGKYKFYSNKDSSNIKLVRLEDSVTINLGNTLKQKSNT